MRKVLLLLSALFIMNTVNAQTEHLKFMGIPLCGNYKQFESNLKMKGVKYDKAATKEANVKGCRFYNGEFSGENAEIIVYYDKETNSVYRAKALISNYSTEIINKLEDFKSRLLNKYISAELTEGEQDGYKAYSFRILDKEFKNAIGYISLFIGESGFKTYLHIDYNDIDSYLPVYMKRNSDL